MADFYDRPMPGESLLSEPKSRPYERPARLPKLEKVIEFYMDRITNDEFIDNICRMLELGTPVELIVESITIFFVMKGEHSMDNRVLVSPLLHEFIRMIGKQAGIDVVDGLNATPNSMEAAGIVKVEKLREEIDRLRDSDEDDGGVDLMEQTADLMDEQEQGTDDLMETDAPMTEPMPMGEMPQEQIPLEEEPPQEMPTPAMLPDMEQGQGLMARRQ
tara:strand:+ start:2151 stop:2801 length:651 start_codon:yes stop_codon:yes gene_type:complete